MKHSPIHMNYETSDYGVHEFDPQVDFSQVKPVCSFSSVGSALVFFNGYKIRIPISFGCDFDQFLEEARQHAREVKFQAPSTFSEETGKKKLGEDKKTKKSWKKSLFSWLKMEKNSKHPSMQPAANTSHISKPRKGHVSGPISGSSSRGDGMRQRRPTSGPIAYFFSPSRKVENEIPYMCLDQLNNPHHVKSYGPVYLVT